MKYGLEQDVRELKEAGCYVSATTQTNKGYVILWSDDQGYTVTVREPKASSVGGARSYEVAMVEFEAAVRRLIGG